MGQFTLESPGSPSRFYSQILSPGHRRPTGQDPKIWGKQAPRTAGAPLLPGVLSHHPLPGPSLPISEPFLSPLPLLGAWKKGWQRLLVAFCLCFDAGMLLGIHPGGGAW